MPALSILTTSIVWWRKNQTSCHLQYPFLWQCNLLIFFYPSSSLSLCLEPSSHTGHENTLFCTCEHLGLPQVCVVVSAWVQSYWIGWFALFLFFLVFKLCLRGWVLFPISLCILFSAYSNPLPAEVFLQRYTKTRQDYFLYKLWLLPEAQMCSM